MADVASAYRFLNDSLKLGLTQEVLEHTEKELMLRHLEANAFPPGARDPGEWEFFLHVKPRRDARR